MRHMPTDENTPPYYIAIFIALIILAATVVLFSYILTKQSWKVDHEPALQDTGENLLDGSLRTTSADPLEPPKPAASDWQTYRNEDFNFEVRYPPQLQGTS